MSDMTPGNSSEGMIERLRAAGFDVLTRNHAEAILAHDFPGELATLVAQLTGFRISISELVGGGGGESGQTQRLRNALHDAQWRKHQFSVQTIVDGTPRDSISHEVDHVRFAPGGTLALEIEWNNKDPFYDRDLENFQRLHAQGAVSLGLIVTRGSRMQDAFHTRIAARLVADGAENDTDLERYGIVERTAAQRRSVAALMEKGMPFAEAFTRNFVSSKFGQATTHWDKLRARVDRGVGNPCPLLLIGLPDTMLAG